VKHCTESSTVILTLSPPSDLGWQPFLALENARRAVGNLRIEWGKRIVIGEAYSVLLLSSAFLHVKYVKLSLTTPHSVKIEELSHLVCARDVFSSGVAFYTCFLDFSFCRAMIVSLSKL
jgi:hypothetical protein